MGKTSKPLIIVALPPCSDWEELAALEKQGHVIIRAVKAEVGFNLVRTADLIDADIILAPQAWRMSNQHKPYLALAIKEARMLRYPNENRADKKTRARVAADLSIDKSEPSE